MAPRPQTAVESLRDLAQYVDPSFHPTLAEVPGLLAALLENVHSHGALADKVDELRKAGTALSDARHEISHLIAPVDEQAGATVVQGAPSEQVAALQAQVAELKSLLDQPLPASPDQLELQTLREQVQSLQIQAAAGQHPTADSEPIDEEQP